MHFLIYNPQNTTWRTRSLGWILRRYCPGSDENLSGNRYEQEGSSNGFNLAICGRGKSYKWGLALLTDQRRAKQRHGNKSTAHGGEVWRDGLTAAKGQTCSEAEGPQHLNHCSTSSASKLHHCARDTRLSEENAFFFFLTKQIKETDNISGEKNKQKILLFLVSSQQRGYDICNLQTVSMDGIFFPNSK